MNEMNLDWDDLRLFLAVAQHGGLAGAVSVTGKSAPTLGRRMLSLEKRLGQELFERQARGYVLTHHGQVLLDNVLSMETLIAPILSSVKDSTVQRVKVSAGMWVTQLLCQHALRLRGDDAVVLQFIAADHALDFSHREAVIGVRNHRPDAVSLAGRQVGEVRFAVYASSPDVTTWARVVGTTPSANWLREQLKQVSMTPETCIEVTDPRNAMDLALSGAAKVILPRFVGDATPGLKRVSGVIEELSHTQWLVTHHEERHDPMVRRVIERIYEVLIETASG